jgi:hypothetical protein
MARVPIPTPDVPFLNSDGRTVSRPWYEFLSSVDALRVQDLSDIASGAGPSDTNTIRFNAANKTWNFGA